MLEDLDGRIDCILQSDPTVIGLESTVVDCTSDVPIVLRKGGVSLESLRSIIPEIKDHESDATAVPRSPGLKHRHYSPRATVVLVTADEKIDATAADGYIGLTKRDGSFRIAMVCENVESYAHSLFEFFRKCDRTGVKRIFCESVADAGIGAALMDRIRRAAAG